MAKKAKKQASKKKATPAKKKLKPAAKKPASPVKKAAKPAAKKSAAPKAKSSASGKSKKAAKPAAKHKPAPKSIPSKAKAPQKDNKPAQKAPAKPIKTELKKAAKPERPKAAPAKVAKPEPKQQAPEPKKAPPAKQPAQKLPPPPPVPAEPEVPHILRKGPPPPELKAQFNALKKKKLPPGEKRVVKTEIVNPHVIKDKPIAEKAAPKKEPKGKFVLEFILHAPVTLLYDFLTTPNGLAEWFADEVDLKNDTYTFNWDGAIQQARIVSAKLDSYLRLRWLDKAEGSYFEFRIQPDELTNEIALLITDFGESEDDVRTSRQLWDSQIHRLMKAMGTY